MPTIPTTAELFSIGQIAADLQADPRAIRRALDERGLRPALVLNGRAFFDADAIGIVRDELQRTREGAES